MRIRVNYAQIFLHLLLCNVCALALLDGLLEGVDDDGQKSNPGSKIRVTQKGFNYLNEVAKQQMAELIPRLRMKDMTFAQLGGESRLTNTRVTKYTPPDSQSLTLKPPDQVVLTMKGMDMSTTGHIYTTSALLSDQGDFDSTATNVDLTYAVKVLRQANGQLGVKTKSCKANIGKFTMRIYNTGPLGQFMDTIKNLLIVFVKTEVGNQLCAQGTRYFDSSINDQFSSVPTKIWLNETEKYMRDEDEPRPGQPRVTPAHTSGPTVTNRRWSATPRPNRKISGSSDYYTDDTDSDRGSGASAPKPNPRVGADRETHMRVKELMRNTTKHLMFDYSNLKDPVVTKQYMETYNAAEISYHGQGGTPFYPPEASDPHPYPNDRMGYVVATDYVANSMMYQAFKNNLLKQRISAVETPDMASFLRTSCDDDFFGLCLGSVVPEIRNTFPNSRAEILVEANDAPAVFFRSNGDTEIRAPVTVTMNAVRATERRLMAVADVDVKAKAKLYIRDQRIRGSTTIDSFQVRMKTNNIQGFTQQKADDFARTVKATVQEMCNGYLREGLPLPVLNGVHFVNTNLNIYDRTMRIDSDVKVDQKVMSKIIADAVKEHGDGVTVDGK